MGTILKFPPCVKHVGHRPPQELQSSVVDRALLNLRAPKAACKLMKFYAARSDGFRPSLKMIHEETGIDEHNVSRCRALLIRYGLIGYNGKIVLIDWVRLCALASMNNKLMGQKGSWQITTLGMNLLDAPKNDVHTYIGTGNQESKRLYAIYEATQQAIANGVKFPELEGSEIAAKLLGQPKNDVHTYIGTENLIYGPDGYQLGVGWYNPFDEPDPDWVYQLAVVDAYGEIVAYTHYNTQLPF